MIIVVRIKEVMEYGMMMMKKKKKIKKILKVKKIKKKKAKKKKIIYLQTKPKL